MNHKSKIQKTITEKLRKDLGSLRTYWPSTYFSISQLLDRDFLLIPLNSGDFHEVDRNQLIKIKEYIPEHLWDLIKLPLTFRYEKDNDGRSWYVIIGNRWQKRAVEILIYGKLSSEGLEKIDVQEFKKLVKNFSSLIFVSISTSLS